MWSILDTLGASLIGGMVLLMVISINLQMNNLSSEIIEYNIVQSNLTSSTEDIKYDFYKIGYKVNGSKIGIADSNQIKFYADINNDDNIDTLHFSFVKAVIDTAQGSINPNGILYKSINGGNNQIASFSTNFNLSYYDSIGQAISYQSLANQQWRDKIRTIKIELLLSSNYAINNNISKTDWSSTINPKNLRNIN